MELLGQPLIAGKPTPSSNSKTFTATNPATNAPLSPPFQESTTDQVNAACTAAQDAFQQTRRSTPKERATLLRTIADEILALGDPLILRTVEETGLPRPRIEGERGRTVGQLKLFADLVEEGSWVDATLDRAQPDRQPLPKPDLRRMLVPLGPVAVFGASNFPLAFSVAGGDTASALAAGCPVVCKGHPAHPGTSELVARAISRAIEKTNFPPGTFSLLQGASTDYALALVRHPVIKAVGFTGSLRAGRALYDEAARRPDPIPVYAEMGSTNPVFVLPGALKERADQIATGLAASVTLGVGQFCTKPGLIFLQDSPESARLLETAATSLAAVAPGTMLHAGIRAHFQSSAANLAKVAGVTQKITAHETASGNCQQSALFFLTTADNLARHPEIAEEVFGPSTVAVTTNSRDQLLTAARNLQGHLTATIHGTEADLKDYADLVDLLHTKVGRLIFNGWPTGVEVTHAMVHGGPYPATTDPRTTSVGTAAIYRWARPVCYQNFPQASLPEELRDGNPRNIWRRVEGKLTRD
jgi:alpha-ketoglutaric semialdehyde dehydrogenase